MGNFIFGLIVGAAIVAAIWKKEWLKSTFNEIRNWWRF